MIILKLMLKKCVQIFTWLRSQNRSCVVLTPGFALHSSNITISSDTILSLNMIILITRVVILPPQFKLKISNFILEFTSVFTHEHF